MKISVIIPAYNEENTLPEILRLVLRQKAVGEVIVVDDGSKDSTWKLLKKIQLANPRIKPIRHAINLGKGAAIRTGLTKATLNYILIQDADLEYSPANYGDLLKHASCKVAVYGSRLKTANDFAYLHTLLGNILITALGNILFGIKLTDSYTGYKLLPAKMIRSLQLKSDGFEIEAEITGKLAKSKVPIIEVPITYHPRKYNEGKKIKAKDALKGAVTYLKIKFKRESIYPRVKYLK